MYPMNDAGCPDGRPRYVHYLRRIRLQDGGVVRAVLDTCSALACRGNDVTLLTTEATDAPEAWRQGVKDLPRLVVIPVPRLIGSPPREVDDALKDAQLLHLHTPWEWTNLVLANLAGRRRLPYVVTIHGMLDDWSLRQKWLKKRLFLALAGRRFLARATRVHCTAAAELRQAASFLRPGSGVVLPCPIDLALFTDLPGTKLALAEYPELTGEAPIILFLSRLDPKKRPELLIEAASRLTRRGQPCRLVLAGPGDPAYVAALRRLAHQIVPAHPVLFTGMVHGLTKVSLLQAADVFVLPSSQENFGIVLVEAMAAGTPVITTRGVDIWQELQDAGALIVDHDVEEIATAIQNLIADLPRARERGQRGRTWALRELNADKVICGYEHMYQDVCRSPLPAAFGE